MFKSCFVAKVQVAQERGKVNTVDIFCRYDGESDASSSLPNAQNLGCFCYPAGAENVKPKEYMAPEVKNLGGKELEICICANNLDHTKLP